MPGGENVGRELPVDLGGSLHHITGDYPGDPHAGIEPEEHVEQVKRGRERATVRDPLGSAGAPFCGQLEEGRLTVSRAIVQTRKLQRR